MPTVFISYANDDPDWPSHGVEALAVRLMARGVEAVLDTFYRRTLGREPSDSEWTDWAIERTSTATQVLCLISPLYTERAQRDRLEEPRGRGLAVEIVEIEQRLKRNKQRNLGQIFIYAREGSDIPPFLRGRCPEYSAPHGEDALLVALSHGSAAGDLAGLVRRQSALVADECVDWYVPLEGVGRGFDRPLVRLPQSVRSCMTFRPGVWTRHADITEAIEWGARAVIVGEPGAGKTFSLLKILEDDLARVDMPAVAGLERWLSLDTALAEPGDPSLRRDADYMARREMQERQLDALGHELGRLFIPVFVRLREWIDPDKPFDQFLATQAPELGLGLRRWFQCGRVRLLLDGINELPQRSASARQIESLLDWLEGGKGSFILTTRNTLELPERLAAMPQTIAIEPMRATRIKRFVEAYLADTAAAQRDTDAVFWRIVGPELRPLAASRRVSAGESEFDRLVAGELSAPSKWTSAADHETYLRICSDPGRQYSLATNPYMLAMLLWAHRELDAEPTMSRVELFERYLGARIDGEIKKSGSDLAVDEMHGHFTDLAVELQDIGSRRTIQGRSQEKLSVPVVTETQQQQTIVAVGVGARVIAYEGVAVAFRHQLLQEYYVARFMQQQWSRGRLAFARFVDEVVARETERSAWEETLVLFADYCPRDVEEILMALVDIQPEIAASVWERTRLRSPQLLTAELQSRMHHVLVRQTFGSPTSPQEAALNERGGRALGRMHTLKGRPLDARPGVSGWYDVAGGQRVVDIAWIALPAPAASRRDYGAHRPGLRIATFPVTVAQFRVFLEDPEGWSDRRWWAAGDARAGDPRLRLTDQPGNLPCTQVSWYEAMAFCAWLSSLLQCSVRLPDVAEWLAAAAGASSRRYPWGDAWHPYYANAGGLFDRCVAVGTLAKGATPEGVCDLAGNVLEWVRSGPARRMPQRTPEYELALGGSWSSDEFLCRNGVQTMYLAQQRYEDIGFRVLRDDARAITAGRWPNRLLQLLRRNPDAGS